MKKKDRFGGTPIANGTSHRLRDPSRPLGTGLRRLKQDGVPARECPVTRLLGIPERRLNLRQSQILEEVGPIVRDEIKIKNSSNS